MRKLATLGLATLLATPTACSSFGQYNPSEGDLSSRYRLQQSMVELYLDPPQTEEEFRGEFNGILREAVQARTDPPPCEGFRSGSELTKSKRERLEETCIEKEAFRPVWQEGDIALVVGEVTAYLGDEDRLKLYTVPQLYFARQVADPIDTEVSLPLSPLRAKQKMFVQRVSGSVLIPPIPFSQSYGATFNFVHLESSDSLTRPTVFIDEGRMQEELQALVAGPHTSPIERQLLALDFHDYQTTSTEELREQFTGYFTSFMTVTDALRSMAGKALPTKTMSELKLLNLDRALGQFAHLWMITHSESPGLAAYHYLKSPESKVNVGNFFSHGLQDLEEGITEESVRELAAAGIELAFKSEDPREVIRKTGERIKHIQ